MFSFSFKVASSGARTFTGVALNFVQTVTIVIAIPLGDDDGGVWKRQAVVSPPLIGVENGGSG